MALSEDIEVVTYYKDNFNRVTIPGLLKKHDIYSISGAVTANGVQVLPPSLMVFR